MMRSRIGAANRSTAASTGRRDGTRAVLGRGSLVVATFLALAACAAETGSDGDGMVDAGYAATPGTPEGLPAHAPARFGFGSEASAARVAMWDIDVRPDGEGLPAGSGSVTEGRDVYMVHCVACHGPTGVEGPNDRLVEVEQWEDVPSTRAIGNYWPYATTLYDFIRKAMPQLTPGVLSDDEVYAVIAYLLYLNEIVPEDAVLDAESLPAVVMPARDKFVVDDRTGGPGVVR
jgi:S-disulfanyl-L-cysteine oxidoreductase SoxD